MASGIRDKVAILGMGCSRFGERWGSGAEELMLEAFQECLGDAGIGQDEIGAAWFATAIEEVNVGKSGLPLSTTLRLPNVPVTHVENMCASGTEAFRGACYAVAAGAVDFALALGVEKLKDTGYGGLPGGRRPPLQQLWVANMTAPGTFAQLASAYQARHGVGAQDLKRAIGHVSWKSHQNGALNDKAHLRKAVDLDTILAAPIIAAPLGLYDCCGVSDGAAAAIVTTPEIARSLGRRDLVTVKALQLAVSNGSESGHRGWDGSYLHTTRVAARRAYAEAGIRVPREELSVFEVHDCFSITELVTMEDLQLSAEGQGWKDVLDGVYDAGGRLPCQTDGGLKCFGHPIGASGLRMLYEMYLQLQGRAGRRQRPDPRLALTHNLGGEPRENVASVAIIGRADA
jgi:acetyl-CoA C-acetyltransferase